MGSPLGKGPRRSGVWRRGLLVPGAGWGSLTLPTKPFQALRRLRNPGHREGCDSLRVTPLASSSCVLSHSAVSNSAISWTVSPPGSPVPGVLQARTLEWVAIPFPGGLPDQRTEPMSPAMQADSLPSEPPGKPQEAAHLESEPSPVWLQGPSLQALRHPLWRTAGLQLLLLGRLLGGLRGP